MKKQLQRLDSNYYRAVELLIAHAELEHLGQWQVDVRRRSKIALGERRSPHSSRQLPGLVAMGQVDRRGTGIRQRPQAAFSRNR
jgi:hypothetical protein